MGVNRETNNDAKIFNRFFSEKGYHLLFESMSEGFAVGKIIYDRSGKPIDYQLIDLNPAYERISGFSREKSLAMTIRQLYPAAAPELIEIPAKVVESGEPSHQEIYAENSGKTYESYVYRPGPGLFAALFTDVTERKRSEQALRESEERFRIAQESSLDAFSILTAVREENGRIVDFRWEYLNPAAGRILQKSPDQLVGQRLLQILPGNKNNSDLFDRYVRVVETGEPHDYELTYESEGIKGWFRNMTVKLGDGVAVHFADISERKYSEQKLRESESRLSAAVQIAQLGIWEYDMATGVTRHDERCCQIFGTDKDRLISNEQMFALIHPEDRTRVERQVLAALDPQGTGLYESEYRIILPDGTLRWVAVRGNAITNSEGADRRTDRFIGTAMDITDRKRAEEELRLLNESLEQKVSERTKLAEDRAKQLQQMVSELTLSEQRERQRLAEILHDHLQQLLVGAKINSEVLSASIDTQHKQIAENILELITQSLQTSRSLTAELSPPVLRKGNLSAALEWLGRWMQEKHGLTVELQTDSSMDPQQDDVTIFLFQAVRELLFNSVKHAGVKSARVEVSRTDNSLRVAVIDRGTGFDPGSIWDRAQSGTGFGLLNIRERIELLGGNLEIESSPGKGASFALIIPVETTRETGERRVQKLVEKIHEAKRDLDKIRVLLADDHAVVRDGLSTKLNLYSDIEVAGEAADGEEAVKLAREIVPDVILMDIGMPKMTGIEATRLIHSELPHIRIIGLSMYDREDQAAAMIEAGASAYRLKSENTDLLLAAIRGRPNKPT